MGVFLLTSLARAGAVRVVRSTLDYLYPGTRNSSHPLTSARLKRVFLAGDSGTDRFSHTVRLGRRLGVESDTVVPGYRMLPGLRPELCPN